MRKTKDVATEFLSHKRVAVTGVSRHPENHGSNVVYKRLRDRGYGCSPGTRTPTSRRVIIATTT
jgi:predicted CoA-binding protein